MAKLSADLMRSAFDSAPDAMVIIDAGDTIVFANDRVSSLFGYEVNEITGLSVEFLRHNATATATSCATGTTPRT